jgi:hypothetical protein
LFKLTALIGLTAHPRMQAETVGVGAQWLSERRRAPWCVLQAQYFAPGARRQGDVVGTEGCLQWGEHVMKASG